MIELTFTNGVRRCGATMGWFVAVCVVLGSVGAVILSRRLMGSTAARIAGGLLFSGGLAVVLTYYRWYWLPTEYVTPMLVVCPVVALFGLGTVLLGGRIGATYGGLSAMCGVLALGLAAAEWAVPEMGSYARDQLTVAAMALALVAVAAGLAAIGGGRASALRHVGAAVAVAGAGVTAALAYRRFPTYGEAIEQQRMIVIAVVGGVGLLVLAVALVARRPKSTVGPRRPESPPLRPPGDLGVGQPAPPSPPVAAGSQPVAAGSQPVAAGSQPVVVASPPAAITVAWAPRSRLELTATVIGLITGIIAIVRELVNLLRSLVG